MADAASTYKRRLRSWRAECHECDLMSKSAFVARENRERALAGVSASGHEGIAALFNITQWAEARFEAVLVEMR